MSRFHIYRLKNDDILAIDLQANSLAHLPSRMMAPVYDADEMPWTISRLNPKFVIDGKSYVMSTQRMAAIPAADIGDLIADLSLRSDDITAALDFLFQGF